MINDATVIRLEFGKNPERISPLILSELTAKVESMFHRSASALMNQDIKAILSLIAAPRQGSLEFHFHVHISNEIGIEPARLPEEKKGRLRAALAEYASIGAFLWALLWAPGGLVDGTAHEVERPSSETAIVQVRREIAESVGIGRLLEADLTNLQQIARRAGAERMEIQLPDENPVLLFEGRTRVDRQLIGRRATSIDPVELSGNIRPLSSDIIRVRYKGRIYKAFAANRVPAEGQAEVIPNQIFLIIWSSKRAIPKITEKIVIQASPVELHAIEPLDPVPNVFEYVTGIAMVTGAAQFK